MKHFAVLFLSFFCLINLQAQISDTSYLPVITGAESADEYLSLLKGKRIGVFTNQTGRVGDEHVIDWLKRKGFDKRNGFELKVIFAPEHGFRGNSDAGEKIDDTKDVKTGIPIYSLYKNKSGKPTKEIMSQIDILIVDIQDVGLRFYTYYISMYKLMDACAENNKKMIIFDRPNPNGFYVDGPILDMKYKSGVGYLPIPVVHGMTLGELAQMINGENWLPKNRKCELQVIKCKNYTHRTKYQLPVPPSPNLPDMKSVYLYPSICLFEGTPVSLGRGTSFPFQVYGSPNMKEKGYAFSFTPQSISGAKNPPYLNKKCYGVDLRDVPNEKIWKAGVNLDYIIDAYSHLKIGESFFTPFFQNLIGVDYVKKMILNGRSADEIKARWKADVERFKTQRKPYLLYEE